ncbi:MAG: hypothetical protein LBP39_00795, partial [Rickettsiales bacterium]|nr:hypothetical protein [Rickettsiales bacterium]
IEQLGSNGEPSQDQINKECDKLLANGISPEDQRGFIGQFLRSYDGSHENPMWMPEEYGGRKICMLNSQINKKNTFYYDILSPYYRETGNLEFGVPINLIVALGQNTGHYDPEENFAAAQIFWSRDGDASHKINILCGEKECYERILESIRNKESKGNVYYEYITSESLIKMGACAKRTSLHGAMADLSKGGICDLVRIDIICKLSESKGRGAVDQLSREVLFGRSFKAEKECTDCAIFRTILAPVAFREEGSTELDAAKFYNFRLKIIPSILGRNSPAVIDREKDMAIFNYLLQSYGLFHLIGSLDVDEEEAGFRKTKQFNGYNVELLGNPEKQKSFLEKIENGALRTEDAIFGYLTAAELDKLIRTSPGTIGVNALAGFENYGNNDTLEFYDAANVVDDNAKTRFNGLKKGSRASFAFNLGGGHFIAVRILYLENNDNKNNNKTFIILKRDSIRRDSIMQDSIRQDFMFTLPLVEEEEDYESVNYMAPELAFTRPVPRQEKFMRPPMPAMPRQGYMQSDTEKDGLIKFIDSTLCSENSNKYILYNINHADGINVQEGDMGDLTCGLHAITALANGGLMDRIEREIRTRGTRTLENTGVIEKHVDKISNSVHGRY